MNRDQPAEITIIGDEDAVVSVGQIQDDRILEISRIIPADASHVVPKTEQMASDADVGAGVDQEPHASAEALVNSARWRSARTPSYSRSNAARA